MTYCQYCIGRDKNDVHRIYHDSQYGFPVEDDNMLFGRLIMEVNQAGLSWEIILKKAEQFKLAYSLYDIKKVAGYDHKDIERLLGNAGIIRNKLKIEAAIYNARQILHLKDEFGSFGNWLNAHHPLTKEEWTKLFKKNFKFVGGEIVNEFLMSIGYLPGAHEQDCPVYDLVKIKKPKWMEV